MKKRMLTLFVAASLSVMPLLANDEMPGLAQSSDYYTLDGTLEPEEIAGLARSSNYTPDWYHQDGVYAPDDEEFRADGPARVSEKVLLVLNETKTMRPDGRVIMPTATPTDTKSTMLYLANNDPTGTRTVPPKSTRTRFDRLDSLDAKNYVLVQYVSSDAQAAKQAAKKNNAVQQSAATPNGKTAAVHNHAPQTDAATPVSEMSLEKSLRTTLAANAKRGLSTQTSTPGNIMLMTLPYGADAMVFQPSQTTPPNPKDKNAAPKGNYIYSIGTLCWNYPCGGKTLLRTDGKRVFAKVGAGYQQRPSSFLALLAMSNIMPNYELKVSGGMYSIAHLVAYEKAAVCKGKNMSMTLVGLSFYSEAKEAWKNEMNETWSIEKIVVEELNRPIDQGSSEVTDWLLGLTAAVNLYEDEGKSINGPVALAKKQVGIYHDFVLSIQNEQGLWHPKFFLYKGSSSDVYETLYSSGHVLRWLSMSMSDKQLRDPKIVKAITSLNALVNRIPTNAATNAMTDRQLEALAVSLHALSVYKQRVFGDDNYAAN